MAEYINITGHKYGMLTPIKVDHKGKWDEYWLCQCDCGKKTIRGKSAMRKGLVTSCGCDRYRRAALSLSKPTTYRIEGNIAYGIMSSGVEFKIDLEDLELIKNFAWYQTPTGYVCNKNKNNWKLLHRLIMNPPDNMDIDHKNGDKLDNRKQNLRICTRGQNLANKAYDNKTGYRGVFQLPSGRFIAQIRDTYLGSFDTALDAHEAYVKEAREKYGEFLYEPQILLPNESQQQT